MARICVVGAGHVGLVTAGCLAELGHDVTCIEIDPGRVDAVRKNMLPVAEPQLDDLWEIHQRTSRLQITGWSRGLVAGQQFIFLCVDTPSAGDGSPDVTDLFDAAESIRHGLAIDDAPDIVIKSTVPVGTGSQLETFLNHGRSNSSFMRVVSNPEFLREGHGVQDYLSPSRVVIGSADEAASLRVAHLYEPLDCPKILCDSRTAELIKYASNAFLATKVSFINEIALLCEGYGASVDEVARGVGMDPRIGSEYLSAGLGWGGHCLPKDMRALLWMARERHLPSPLLAAVHDVNERQPKVMLSKLETVLGNIEGATIAVWGITYKPDCADVRSSRSVEFLKLLVERGCRVRVYDPAADPASVALDDALVCEDPYQAADGADAVVLTTAWKEFAAVDFARLRRLMRRAFLVDARNALNPDTLGAAGFIYVGVGRGAPLRSAATEMEPLTATHATNGAHAAPPAFDFNGADRPSQFGHSANGKSILPLEQPEPDPIS